MHKLSTSKVDDTPRVGKEVKRDGLSPSISPRIDLERRHSTDNYKRKMSERSKSLSNLRTKLNFFSDTTDKMIKNNKHNCS
jgi:hypothetical protein